MSYTVFHKKNSRHTVQLHNNQIGLLTIVQGVSCPKDKHTCVAGRAQQDFNVSSAPLMDAYSSSISHWLCIKQLTSLKMCNQKSFYGQRWFSLCSCMNCMSAGRCWYSCRNLFPVFPSLLSAFSLEP